MIAEELMSYLAQSGFGTVGTDLFYGTQPDSPDNCITVLDSNAPSSDDSNSLSVDQYGVQVLVRNKLYAEARTKVLAVHRQIAGFGGVPFVTNGTLVHVVFTYVPPQYLGKDEKVRNEWEAQYIVRCESIGDIFRL